jgi:hypothetical protein
MQPEALRATEVDDMVGQLIGHDLEIPWLLRGGRLLAEIAVALGVSYKLVANTCTQIKAMPLTEPYRAPS